MKTLKMKEALSRQFENSSEFNTPFNMFSFNKKSSERSLKGFFILFPGAPDFRCSRIRLKCFWQ